MQSLWWCPGFLHDFFFPKWRKSQLTKQTASVSTAAPLFHVVLKAVLQLAVLPLPPVKMTSNCV